MTQPHIGLSMIGINGLQRKNLGTKALVVILDNIWSDLAKSVIGSSEVDMNDNGSIIYFVPNFIMDTRECVQHLNIGIKTKGYEMIVGSFNLRITTRFIRKIQEHSNFKFKLNNEEIELMLASQGIKEIEGKKYILEIYACTEWNVNTFIEKPILVPNESTSYENQDGSFSMRFLDYQHRQIRGESEDDFESIQSKLEDKRSN